MIKQVIVVRRDLKLGRGKIAAQVAHASLNAYKRSDPKVRKIWEDGGEKKVVLKVDNEKALIDLYKKAQKHGVVCVLIRDAGKTQIPRGTVTALGIGPDKSEKIDRITRNLKLL